MKRVLLAATAISVLATGQVFAQAIVVAPEQRTMIREYVV